LAVYIYKKETKNMVL